MFDKTIKTAADVKEFFLYLVQEKGLNLHPDTDFSEYIDLETGKTTFSGNEINRYNTLMDDSFSICERDNVDIYDLSFTILKGRLKV